MYMYIHTYAYIYVQPEKGADEPEEASGKVSSLFFITRKPRVEWCQNQGEVVFAKARPDA